MVLGYGDVRVYTLILAHKCIEYDFIGKSTTSVVDIFLERLVVFIIIMKFKLISFSFIINVIALISIFCVIRFRESDRKLYFVLLLLVSRVHMLNISKTDES